MISLAPSLVPSGDWRPARRVGLPPLAWAQRQCRRVARHVVSATHGGDDPLLDFGAGGGHIADEVLAECGATPICIEPDPVLAARLVAKGYPVRRLADLPDGTAHALYSVHALACIQHEVGVLAAAVKKLVPGAPVLIYVPAFALLYGKRDVAAGHWRRYTRASLTKTLEQAGVQVQQSGYADSIGFLVSSALRVMNDVVSVTPRRAQLYDSCLYPASGLFDPMLGALLGANVWACGVRAA